MAKATAYEPVCNWLMFDAKTPADASRPGGMGKAFDWRLLAGRDWRRPWILSGGLTADNVGQAIRNVRPWAVDVSSGVETDGAKDAAKIHAFVQAAKEAG